MIRHEKWFWNKEIAATRWLRQNRHCSRRTDVGILLMLAIVAWAMLASLERPTDQVAISVSAELGHASFSTLDQTIWRTTETEVEAMRLSETVERSATLKREMQLTQVVAREMLINMTQGSVDPTLESSPPAAVLQTRSFALLALSRGQGVSEAGLRAIADFRSLLRGLQADGKIIRITDTRIGIEGETRICAEFITPELAGQVWSQMRRIISGVDLVRLSPESC
jgi:hypothetical protein